MTLTAEDCGIVHITDGTIRTKLKERAPEKAAEIEGMEFGEIEKYCSLFFSFGGDQAF